MHGHHPLSWRRQYQPAFWGQQKAALSVPLCNIDLVRLPPSGAFPLSSTAIHEYTLLQQAMGSQSSTAQNVLSNCPPAMVM